MERELRQALKNGKFENVDNIVSQRMKAIYSKGTGPERVLKIIIRSLVPKRKRVYFNHTMVGKPDIFIPSIRLAIFCDGCFFHGCREHGHIPKVNSAYWAKKIDLNIKRDSRKRQLLRKNGYHVWRIWEHQLNDRSSCQRLKRNLARRPLIRHF